MRSISLALAMICLALPAWNSLSAQAGVEADRVSRPAALDDGLGVVVISIRSEIYLDDPLHVYFLREGGDVKRAEDVVWFERRQSFFAFSNDTVKYKIRAYQLPAGRYRLVAHGMNCAKVPAIDERCLIEVSGLTGTVELSRPSRGYGEEAPVFEVKSGAATYAGDYALTARNTVEWSEIPAAELARTRRQFGQLPNGPVPVIPESFIREYGLFPRTYEDDMNRRY